MTFTFYFLSDQRLIVPGVRSQVAIPRDPNLANSHCPWASLSVSSRCFTTVRPEIPGGRLAQKSFRKSYKNVDLPTRALTQTPTSSCLPGVAFTCWVRASRSPASPPPQRPHPLGALQPQCTPPLTAPSLTPASSPDPPLPFSQTPLLLSGSHPNKPALPPRGFLRAGGALGGTGVGDTAPRALPATQGRCPSAAAKGQRGRLCGTARGWRGAGVGRARPGM